MTLWLVGADRAEVRRRIERLARAADVRQACLERSGLRQALRRAKELGLLEPAENLNRVLDVWQAARSPQGLLRPGVPRFDACATCESRCSFLLLGSLPPARTPLAWRQVESRPESKSVAAAYIETARTLDGLSAPGDPRSAATRCVVAHAIDRGGFSTEPLARYRAVTHAQ